MDGRKRSSRIQGSWASSSTSSAKSTSAHMPSMDEEPKSGMKLKFEEPNKVDAKPKPITITEDGEHILSTGSSGISKITLLRNFIDQTEADWMFEQLKSEIPWQQRMNRRFKIPEPRLTCWFGPVGYKYSGVESKPFEWTPTTRMLMDRIIETTGYSFNSMLANLYRDGHDSVDWHSDNEFPLGDNPVIASLSFGDTRTFELRSNPPLERKGDYALSQHVKVPLSHGSLLTMGGCTQQDWQHRVPKEYHDRGSRINLTYRLMLE